MVALRGTKFNSVSFRTSSSRLGGTTIRKKMSRPLGSQSPWQGTGRYGAQKREHTGKESLVFKPTRRSIQVITGIVLLFLVFTFVRHQHQTDRVSLDGSALGHNRGSSTGSKYAIVTFETRDVTYWKESLGNKYNYVHRHGYPSILFVRSGLMMRIGMN